MFHIWFSYTYNPETTNWKTESTINKNKILLKNGKTKCHCWNVLSATFKTSVFSKQNQNLFQSWIVSKSTKHFSLTEVALSNRELFNQKTLDSLCPWGRAGVTCPAMLALPGQDIRMLVAGVCQWGDLPSPLAVPCLQRLCWALYQLCL